MKTKARGFLSAALALVMVLALMVPAVSALDISVGNEFGGGKVLLKPASPGTGLIAGNTIRAVLEAAGVRDIVAKSLGSSNHANVVKATLQALASLRTSDQVLADRGKKKEKAI